MLARYPSRRCYRAEGGSYEGFMCVCYRRERPYWPPTAFAGMQSVSDITLTIEFRYLGIPVTRYREML
jgi:hypothetical protein